MSSVKFQVSSVKPLVPLILIPLGKGKVDYKCYVFDFERLDVYQKALNFTNEVFNMTAHFSREVQYSLGDQFRRAALSICNNLAEGSRKEGRAKKQFYNFAFDSARECVPMISLSLKQKQISDKEQESLRNECVQICNMIYRLRESIN